MGKSSVASLLTSVDELFTTQEERDAAKRETVVDLQISEISDFPNHPFSHQIHLLVKKRFSTIKPDRGGRKKSKKEEKAKNKARGVIGSSRLGAYLGVLSEHKEPSPVFTHVLSEHKEPSPVFLCSTPRALVLGLIWFFIVGQGTVPCPTNHISYSITVFLQIPFTIS